MSSWHVQLGTFQWLRLHLPMQGVWVWFPVWELRSHRPVSQNIKQNWYCNESNKYFLNGPSKKKRKKEKERKKCVAWPKNVRKLKSISSDPKNWGASVPTDDQNWPLFSMQIQPGNSAGSLSGMVNPQMDFQWPIISDPTFTLSLLQELLVRLCESWRLVSFSELSQQRPWPTVK